MRNLISSGLKLISNGRSKFAQFGRLIAKITKNKDVCKGSIADEQVIKLDYVMFRFVSDFLIYQETFKGKF